MLDFLYLHLPSRKKEKKNNESVLRLLFIYENNKQYTLDKHELKTSITTSKIIVRETYMHILQICTKKKQTI